MALMPGTRLGPHEVLAPLGAGGMGEVYRARDTQLKRDVALKVLPGALALDPERLARFQREAELLASLNHPHIAQIYGVAEADGVRALVMELVDGPTLADVIEERAGLQDSTADALSWALPIAQQLAEAVEYAHEHGIIHRDLKPANIKVTPDGLVKVLDFGLAKAFAQENRASSATTSPAVTQAGAIMGTVAYMSPEQARGATVDKRADIWAFGVVLYEMLTGRRCFDGPSLTDVLAAIIKTEPDWSRLPADTPAHVRRLLARCLTKDAKLRLRDIGEARIAVGQLGASPEETPDGQSRETSRALVTELAQSRPGRIVWAALGAAIVLLVAVGLTLSGFWPSASTPRHVPLRLSIVHTEGAEVEVPAISPDGRRVAYRARRADGMPVLWVRSLDAFAARPLVGTEDGTNPFWSPDSKEIGFFAGGWIKRVPADGGPVQTVTEAAGQSGGGAWGAGTIVFASGDTYLYRVTVTDGTAAAKATPATTLPSKDWSHYWPSFLPDGRHFLFSAKLWTQSAESSEQGVYVGSLDEPATHKLLPDLTSAVYAAPGYLVFARDGVVTARPFDFGSLSLTGAAQPLGDAVANDPVYYRSAISAANDGTLAVRPPPACNFGMGCNSELRLVDRTGDVVVREPARLYNYFMTLEPGGRRAVAAIVDPRTSTQELWLVTIGAATPPTPLTATNGFVGSPVWSHDGARIAYAYQPPGGLDDVYIRDMRSGQTAPLFETRDIWEHPCGWSHDGAQLLIARSDNQSPVGLSVWSFASKRLRPFAERTKGQAVFSPDDRYVAFSSTVTGRDEVYVTTFPNREQTWQLTTEGARALSWSRDGREILVATLSGHIAAYPVSASMEGFTRGTPTTLLHGLGAQAAYSVATADHSRILIRVDPEATKDRGEFRLLFGWTPR